MPMYDPNKLLADSQANAILTKDANTIVLTVTECPEVAAGELGRWVTAIYTAGSDYATLEIFTYSSATGANIYFEHKIAEFKTIGFVFATEEWTDSFFGSNLTTEESDHSFTD